HKVAHCTTAESKLEASAYTQLTTGKTIVFKSRTPPQGKRSILDSKSKHTRNTMLMEHIQTL
ncbi:MAG TPA: hypothetical protein PLM39_02275, partial [Rectinema sp.]|nr:hypothetical protein [Rectinema sp.]